MLILIWYYLPPLLFPLGTLLVWWKTWPFRTGLFCGGRLCHPQNPWRTWIGDRYCVTQASCYIRTHFLCLQNFGACHVSFLYRKGRESFSLIIGPTRCASQFLGNWFVWNLLVYHESAWQLSFGRLTACFSDTIHQSCGEQRDPSHIVIIMAKMK